jgi:hypothetical protein
MQRRGWKVTESSDCFAQAMLLFAVYGCGGVRVGSRACAAGDAADSQFGQETIRLRVRPALSFALFFQVQAPPASSILLILSLCVFQYSTHFPSLSNYSRSVRVPVFHSCHLFSLSLSLCFSRNLLFICCLVPSLLLSSPPLFSPLSRACSTRTETLLVCISLSIPLPDGCCSCIGARMHALET